MCRALSRLAAVSMIPLRHRGDWEEPNHVRGGSPAARGGRTESGGNHRPGSRASVALDRPIHPIHRELRMCRSRATTGCSMRQWKNRTGNRRRGRIGMARSDLLVSPVRAGASGNNKELTATVEAIIAEERAKQHNILADRSTRALRSNGNGRQTGHIVPDPGARARGYVLETPPRKRLEDLFLPELSVWPCGLSRRRETGGRMRKR